MSPAPMWVAFVWERFLGAVQTWPNSAVGAYMRLLIAQIQEGSIPADVRVLAKLAWCDSLEEFEHLWRTYLRAKFPALPDDPTRLANERMAEEREASIQRQETNAARARKAAGARWNAPSNAPSNASSNATQTQTQTKTKTQTQKGASRKRRSGPSELAAAIEAWDDRHDPLPSSVVEQMEAYRQARAKRRAPIYDADQWTGVLEEGRGDYAALEAAFRKAAQARWLSVWPKPGQGAATRPSNVQRGMEQAARFLERHRGDGSPR